MALTNDQALRLVSAFNININEIDEVLAAIASSAEVSATYLALGGGTLASPQTVTGVVKFGPRDGSQEVVKDDSDAGVSTVEWAHGGTQGYIFHLTGTSAMTGSGGSGGALIGLGVNYGGVGLFVNNYLTGVGIKITQRSTITNASAWALLVGQNSSVAEASYWTQENATAKELAKFVSAPTAPGAGQYLTTWYRSVAAAGDTLIGRIKSDDGTLDWNAPIVTTNRIQATALRAEAAGANFDLYDTGATVNQRRWKWSTTGGFLVLSARTDAAASAGDVMLVKHSTGDVTLKAGATLAADTTTGLKIGAATSKLGFFAATPVVKPTGVTVDAAGIHAALVSLGLIAA